MRSRLTPAPPQASGSGPGAAPGRGRMMRFVLLFALYLVIFAFGLKLPLADRLIESWARFNATAAAAVTRVLGFDGHSSGNQLSSGGTSLSVGRACAGVEAMMIFAAALLAFPSTWSRRLTGLLAGILAILAFNVLRLVNLLLVAVRFPEHLELFHIYIWQTLIVVLAFATFLAWGTLFANRR